jgi:type IV pilus assembly protein PilV
MKSLHAIPQRGFTLLEVLIAVVVMSAGLLGVAKMQALALASTSVANMRSIAAIEAASLAATMHENRGYWTSSAPAANPGGKIIITSSGLPATPVFTADPSLTGTVDCTSKTKGTAFPYCTSTPLAAYDLQQWAAELNALMPNYQATINCNSSTPVSCTITINWTEHVVALNSQEASAAAAAVANGTTYLQSPTYTLFVEP